MKHIRKRLFALLITICILFGSIPTVFAGTGIVYDEDGGIWDFDKGIYTAPDGSTVYIYDSDPESGNDTGSTGTTHNPDGSMNIYTDDPPDTTTPSSITTILGYVTIIADDVDFRRAINGYSSFRIRKGETYPYYHAPIQDGQYTWYYIKYFSEYGYVRSDGVSVDAKTGIEYDEDGGVWDFDKGIYTAPDGSTNTIGTEDIKTTFIDPWPDNAPEASYSTLKAGDSGNAVLELTTALKNQGYYNSDPTEIYSDDVASAVHAFQETIGITADGIASILTQHRLFGTIPIGAGFTSNLTMTVYPAEKVDWYNSSINRLWKNGEKYKIYDVQTGNVWWAQRNGGDYHVEAEPLTAADTARMCKSYGVYTAQELANNNLWERRPILLTIGTRTFACSLYGIPHNYPNGDTMLDGTARVIGWKDSSAKAAEIPAELGGCPVTAVGTGAFKDADTETVVIPDSVRTIGYQAFRGCRSLKKIELPESLQFIGSEAFLRCDKLRDVTFPAGLEYVGESAFAYTGITKVMLPASAGTVRNGAFEFCGSLQSVSTGGFENICEEAFAFCPKLKSLTLGEGLQVLEAGAFIGHGLKEITLPASVTEVGSSALYPANVKNALTLTLSGDIPEMSPYALAAADVNGASWPVKLTLKYPASAEAAVENLKAFMDEYGVTEKQWKMVSTEP